MSPEHGPGPEDHDLTPGNEEVKAEFDAREEGRLRQIAELEEQLRVLDARMTEVRENNQPNKLEMLQHLDERRRNLERQLDELEREAG